jgi:small-conductance mechanosensitive channel
MQMLDALNAIVTLPNGERIDLGPALETAAAVLAILVAGWLLVRITRVFVHRVIGALLERANGDEEAVAGLTDAEIERRKRTIEGLFVNVARFFVFVVAGLMILERAFDINIGPAIAGLGVAGIAVGLGTQSLVHDYLNGALIMMENQYSIGDVVNIAGTGGMVEDFTLRRTTLRDLSGTVHTIPNGQINVVSNLTRAWARVNEEVQVAYGTDVDRAREVIDKVGREMAADPALAEQIVEAPHVERIKELGDRGITLLILGKVRPATQWSTSGELRRRLLAAFDENGIEMPTGVLLTWSGQDLAAVGSSAPKKSAASSRRPAKRG